jgi:hypothetical protein
MRGLRRRPAPWRMGVFPGEVDTEQLILGLVRDPPKLTTYFAILALAV